MKPESFHRLIICLPNLVYFILFHVSHRSCRSILIMYQYRWYPLLIKHGNGKPPMKKASIGKPPINGSFSIAMFHYRRVADFVVNRQVHTGRDTGLYGDHIQKPHPHVVTCRSSSCHGTYAF